MPDFCQDKLRLELGQFVTISVENGDLISGTVIGTFRNKVQIGGIFQNSLRVLNSSGEDVTPDDPPGGSAFVEIPCDKIIAASGGERFDGERVQRR